MTPCHQSSLSLLTEFGSQNIQANKQSLFEDFRNLQRTMDIESKVSVSVLFSMAASSIAARSLLAPPSQCRLVFVLIVLVIFQGRNRFVQFLPQLITKRWQQKARVLILYTSMLENRRAGWRRLQNQNSVDLNLCPYPSELKQF